jgi:hypothetical protein
MKKMLVVLGFVALASLAASAASHTLTFDGFCDGMTLVNPTGFTQLGLKKAQLVGGTHNNYDCAGSVASVSGFKMSFPATIAPMDQVGASGPVLNVGSPIIGPATNLSYSVHVKTAAQPFCIWANWIADGTNQNFFREGTCTQSSQPVGNGTRSSAK